MKLRTDLFPTKPRGETLYIAVRDTLTQAHPAFGVYEIDAIHCRQGRLGIGYHFLITVGGDVQLARRIDTVGSHSRNLDEVSVAIGIVGGVDENGVRMNTRTPEQLEALELLVEYLSRIYPGVEVDDRPQS